MNFRIDVTSTSSKSPILFEVKSRSLIDLYNSKTQEPINKICTKNLKKYVLK